MAARRNSLVVFLVQRTLAAVSVVVLPLVMTSTVQADPVVVNFSFEDIGDPVTPPWALDPSPGWYDLPAGGAWTGGGLFDIGEAGVMNAWGTVAGGDLISPPDGTYALNLYTVEQNLSYTVEAGDIITLDYYVGEGLVNAAGDITASILIDGNSVYDHTFANPATDGWVQRQTQTPQPVTSGGNLSIKFHSTGTSDWIDNVSVTVTPAATPEPGAFLLAMLGLLSLGLIRRR